MTIEKCLNSAVSQGAISSEMRDELADLYRAYLRHHSTAYGPAEARRRAQEDLAQRLETEALQRRRAALLQAEAAERLVGQVLGYRNPKGELDPASGLMMLIESFGETGRGLASGSVEGRRKAILAGAHAKLEALLDEHRDHWLTGARRNRPRLDDVAREVLGQSTGDAAARAMAQSVAAVLEDLRVRYNEHGGAIGKIDGGYLPQRHDPRALRKAGFDRWRSYILPRLDRERMISGLTQRPMTDAELDDGLRAAFDAITSDGWSKRSPTMAVQGRGALVRQHAERRFLHFKTADAWLEYSRDFGEGDPFAAIMTHVSLMARDIAAMQVLGPNPDAMLELLRQTVRREASLAGQGLAAAFPRELSDPQSYAETRIHRADQMWAHARGSATTPVSNFWAQTVAAARDVTTSIVMGSAAVSALTDFGTQKLARSFAAGYVSGGLHGRTAFGFDTIYDVLKQMSRDNQRIAVRSGLILDSAAHVMGEQARYVGTLSGPVWSRWLASRVLQLTGLTPITQMQKHAFGLWAMGEVADHMAMPWATTPFRRFFERYGLGEGDYQIMQAARLHDLSAEGLGATILRPAEIEAIDLGMLRNRLADEHARGVRDGLYAAVEGGRVLTPDELAVFIGKKAPVAPALPDGAPSIATDTPDVKLRRHLRNVAERYLEAILQETVYAVPEGTLRSRSLILGDDQPGTTKGEILRIAAQLKSFPVAVVLMQTGRVVREAQAGNWSGAAAYAGGLLIGMTLIGGAVLQLRQVQRGEDLREMNPLSSPVFWGQAALQGGGLGIWGDFLTAATNRHGGGVMQTFAGPLAGKTTDLVSLTAGNVLEAVQGKKTNAGRELAQFVGGNVPGLSSAWYTRLIWERTVTDQLTRLLDPEAHAAFRRKRQRALADRGVQHWWEPGEASPRRGPRVDGVLGR